MKLFYRNREEIEVEQMSPLTWAYIGDAVFDGDNMLTAINVPAESVDAYKAADGWKDYASIIKPINS